MSLRWDPRLLKALLGLSGTGEKPLLSSPSAKPPPPARGGADGAASLLWLTRSNEDLSNARTFLSEAALGLGIISLAC